MNIPALIRCVIFLNPETRRSGTFFRARPETLGEPYLEYVTTPGPRRPVDVRFSPEGDALYVVDIGAMTMLPTARPPLLFPGSGVVWRISHRGARPRELAGPDAKERVRRRVRQPEEAPQFAPERRPEPIRERERPLKPHTGKLNAYERDDR